MDEYERKAFIGVVYFCYDLLIESTIFCQYVSTSIFYHGGRVVDVWLELVLV